MKRPVDMFSRTGMLERRACSAGVRGRYRRTWPVAVARPRRSTREPVQAPVARTVSSACNLVPFLRATPVTILPVRWRELTSPWMKVTRFVASTWDRSQRMPASASAQPLLLLRYPQSPLPPPVPTAASIASRLCSS